MEVRLGPVPLHPIEQTANLAWREARVQAAKPSAPLVAEPAGADQAVAVQELAGQRIERFRGESTVGSPGSPEGGELAEQQAHLGVQGRDLVVRGLHPGGIAGAKEEAAVEQVAGRTLQEPA